MVENKLKDAIENGRRPGCAVFLWKNTSNSVMDGLTCSTAASGSSTIIKGVSELKIACWNCRGLGSSLPYIEQLLCDGVKVLALSEHWLWPYELFKLDEIAADFESVAKADSRLTDNAVGGRGFGGVGLLWHCSLNAVPIAGINSDRICGIRFSSGRGDRDVVSILSVYMPCLDLGLDCYSQHLIELERVISECDELGLVIVLGDFNAHLTSASRNVQRVLLQEVMDLSAGCLAVGPNYILQW